MRNVFAVLVILALAVPMFGHAGEAHTYMGTVTMIDGDSFMMKTKDGKQITVAVTDSTVFTHADDHPGKKSELVVGSRVVVKMNKDGKTASSVKMSSGKKTSMK